jgi:glyoxylase-like metal-dependent hydrolase (beta-lactamase superfamily II)
MFRALLCASAAFAAMPASAGGPYDLELRQLKPDIYLLVRPDVLRQPVEPNALVIVNESDVVVVEGGGAPLVAENAIRLIRSVTDKPVSVLVNTHWHGDHNLGSQAYRAAFPGVRVVGHENTRLAMTGKPMAYVARYPAMLAGTIKEWEALLAAGKLSPARTAMLPDIRLMRAELERIRITPPDVTVTDGLVLHRGAREIHVVHPGKGNTEGDLIVWLPKERVLVAGDLLVAPIPYGFGSFPKEWIDTLDALARYDFELLIPGHGEVLKDREHLRLMQSMLRTVRIQARAAVARGLDLAATKQAVDFGELERRITGDDAERKRLFRAWWIDPIARSAWLEARGEPIVQGASDETG